MKQLLVGTAMVLALASAAPASAQVQRRGVPGAQAPAATAPIPPPAAAAAPPAGAINMPAPAAAAPQPSAAAPPAAPTARLPGAAAAEAAPARPRPRRARPVRAPQEAAPAVARSVRPGGRAPADYIARDLNRQELERLPSGGGMPPAARMAPAEGPAAGDPPYPWRGYGTAGSW